MVSTDHREKRRWESNPLRPVCSRLPGRLAPASCHALAGNRTQRFEIHNLVCSRYTTGTITFRHALQANEASGRRGIRTLMPFAGALFSKEARRTVSGYLMNSEAHEPTHASPVSGSRSSAQRESNPHVRLGKAVGYRYIMGTRLTDSELSKRESTGWESNPRRRVTGAVSWPLEDQCVLSGTGGARTLTARLRAACSAAEPRAETREWGRGDSNPHLPA